MNWTGHHLGFGFRETEISAKPKFVRNFVRNVFRRRLAGFRSHSPKFRTEISAEKFPVEPKFRSKIEGEYQAVSGLVRGI